MKVRVDKLESDNDYLLKQLRTRSGVPILYRGQEADLYPNEIQDLLMAILYDARKSVADDSRRAHVLDDLLETNEFENLAGKKSEELKKLLRGYKKMDGATKQKLKDLGFEISESGPHYKLQFGDDHRYLAVLPKTGSDHHGGMNAAQEIINRVF